MNMFVKFSALTLIWVMVAGSPGFAEDVLLPCGDEPTDVTMQVGDIIECVIEPVTDTDLFRFEGSAGEVVMLSLRDMTAGSGHPRAELYDSNQNFVESLVTDDGGTRLVYPVPESGIYSVLLRENGDNQTATYILGLQRVFPAPPEVQDLCYDCIHPDAIDVLTDSDVFQFEGESGTRIMVTLNDQTGGSGHPVIEIFDPQDLPVGDVMNVNDGGTRQILDLPITGTYSVLVRENGDNQTANYILALQKLDPVLPDVQPLHYSDVYQGEISPVTDSDVLHLVFDPDTTILLTLTDTTGGSGHPILEVFDMAGQVLQTLAANDGSASWQPTFTERGAYMVLIRENGDNQTATFNLGLQCLFGDCPDLSPVETQTWGKLKATFR